MNFARVKRGGNVTKGAFNDEQPGEADADGPPDGPVVDVVADAYEGPCEAFGVLQFQGARVTSVAPARETLAAVEEADIVVSELVIPREDGV